MNNDAISIDELIGDSRLAFIQGKYSESLKLATQAMNLEPNNADAHQCVANAYMSKADYESAIEHLNGWHGGNYKNSLPGEPIKTILDF